MKRTDLNSEERTFLELIAMNVWQARRQGATIGRCLCLRAWASGVPHHGRWPSRSNVIILVRRDSGDDILVVAAGC